MLDLVQHLLRARRVPRLGRDVDAVDGPQLVGLEAAAVAGPPPRRRTLPVATVPALASVLAVAGLGPVGRLVRAAASLDAAAARRRARGAAGLGRPRRRPTAVVSSTSRHDAGVDRRPRRSCRRASAAVTHRGHASRTARRSSCCVLLADNRGRAGAGPDGRDSLGGYDGMLFRFDAPTTSRASTCSTPASRCRSPSSPRAARSSRPPTWRRAPPTTAPGCPPYCADAPYVDALEVPKGGLAPRLGIGPHVGPGRTATAARRSARAGALRGQRSERAEAEAGAHRDHLADVALRVADRPPTGRTTPPACPSHMACSHGTVGLGRRRPGRRCGRRPAGRRRGRRGRRRRATRPSPRGRRRRTRRAASRSSAGRHVGLLGLAQAGRRWPGRRARAGRATRPAAARGPARRSARRGPRASAVWSSSQAIDDAAVAGPLAPAVLRARGRRWRGRSGRASAVVLGHDPLAQVHARSVAATAPETL